MNAVSVFMCFTLFRFLDGNGGETVHLFMMNPEEVQRNLFGGAGG